MICEVSGNETHLHPVSEFKIFVVDYSGTDGAQCCRKVASATRPHGMLF